MRALALLAALALAGPVAAAQPLAVPSAQAGLTDREAAAHALNRLAYGPRPGQVDALAEPGALAAWIDGQLAQSSGDGVLDADLTLAYPSIAMPLREQGAVYPSPAVRLRAFTALREQGGAMGTGRQGRAGRADGMRGRGGAGRSGMGRMGSGRMGAGRMGAGRMGMGQMAGDSTMRAGGGTDALLRDIATVTPAPPERARAAAFVEERLGFRDLRELMFQAQAAKVLRAVYAEDQLAEVLTDVWFNHFNVSITKINDVGPFVPSFERDAIRPHVLGSFREMLGATATHPAMLFYLDNHRSNAAEGRATLAPMPTGDEVVPGIATPPRQATGGQDQQRPGVNENYARELFELHTLGVDGGYTQQDIEEAARVLTGWKVNPLVYPLGEMRGRVEAALTLSPDVREGAVFDPRWHDAEAKTVLGVTFPAGGGPEELGRLLDVVATHPSTARHVAAKLAEAFVSDAPPDALLDDLAETFLATDGDLAAVMRALVGHPAFWAPEAVASKVKTPIETVVSAVRAVGADVEDPSDLIRWVTRMGQPLYAYSAPTGYPERSAAWVNGAALLNRMSFGLDLALNRVDGVALDLLALNGLREPESARDALRTYLPILLPGRDTAETEALLVPTLRAPDVDARVAAAAQAADPGMDASTDPARPSSPGMETLGGNAPRDSQQLAQVVGLILGSPEFQRQ